MSMTEGGPLMEAVLDDMTLRSRCTTVVGWKLLIVARMVPRSRFSRCDEYQCDHSFIQFVAPRFSSPSCTICGLGGGGQTG